MEIYEMVELEDCPRCLGPSILEEENINVVSAMDGKEAIDMFKKSEIGEYDVILMDIMIKFNYLYLTP